MWGRENRCDCLVTFAALATTSPQMIMTGLHIARGSGDRVDVIVARRALLTAPLGFVQLDSGAEVKGASSSDAPI